MQDPGTTKAPAEAEARANPDEARNGSEPIGGRGKRRKRRVAQTDKERERMPSEAFEQLKRLREDSGYLACGTPAQHLADEVVIRWCDRYGQAWPSRDELCEAMTARGKPKGKDAVVDALNDLERNGVTEFPEGREGRKSSLIVVIPAVLPSGKPDGTLASGKPDASASGKPDGEQEGREQASVLRQAQNGSAADAAGPHGPLPLDEQLRRARELRDRHDHEKEAA